MTTPDMESASRRQVQIARLVEIITGPNRPFTEGLVPKSFSPGDIRVVGMEPVKG
jgi:hypothetical protein